jgi:hypothetical protein
VPPGPALTALQEKLAEGLTSSKGLSEASSPLKEASAVATEDAPQSVQEKSPVEAEGVPHSSPHEIPQGPALAALERNLKEASAVTEEAPQSSQEKLSEISADIASGIQSLQDSLEEMPRGPAMTALERKVEEARAGIRDAAPVVAEGVPQSSLQEIPQGSALAALETKLKEASAVGPDSAPQSSQEESPEISAAVASGIQSSHDSLEDVPRGPALAALEKKVEEARAGVSEPSPVVAEGVPHVSPQEIPQGSALAALETKLKEASAVGTESTPQSSQEAVPEISAAVASDIQSTHDSLDGVPRGPALAALERKVEEARAEVHDHSPAVAEGVSNSSPQEILQGPAFAALEKNLKEASALAIESIPQSSQEEPPEISADVASGKDSVEDVPRGPALAALERKFEEARAGICEPSPVAAEGVPHSTPQEIPQGPALAAFEKNLKEASAVATEGAPQHSQEEVPEISAVVASGIQSLQDPLEDLPRGPALAALERKF